MEQIWIYGNSYESVLVAVVVPDEKNFKSFAQQAGAQGSTIEELCKDPKVCSLAAHCASSSTPLKELRRRFSVLI